jgi:DNA-damage-inducible protein J
MAQTNLTIRIDEDIKRDAENLFNKIGLTMSSAINVFLRRPFHRRTVKTRSAGMASRASDI